MKKSMLIVLAGLLAITLGIGPLYAQSNGPGMMGQGRDWGQGYDPQRQGGQYSPYNGAGQQGDRNRNSGRTGRGWDMGPDQRDRGWGTGSGIMGRFLDMFSGGRTGRGWGMGSGCR